MVYFLNSYRVSECENCGAGIPACDGRQECLPHIPYTELRNEPVVQISLDSQGRIVIPSTFRHHLGLSQGMILVVEEGEKDDLFLRIQKESPTLVDKQGVLVVKAEPIVDLTNITQ